MAVNFASATAFYAYGGAISVASTSTTANVTTAASTTGVVVGMVPYVNGTLVAGVTVTAVTGTTITYSANVTIAASATIQFVPANSCIITPSAAGTGATFTTASTAGLVVGMTLYNAAGVALGGTVASFVLNTSVTMSASVTVTTSAVTFIMPSVTSAAATAAVTAGTVIPVVNTCGIVAGYGAYTLAGVRLGTGTVASVSAGASVTMSSAVTVANGALVLFCDPNLVVPAATSWYIGVIARITGTGTGGSCHLATAPGIPSNTNTVDLRYKFANAVNGNPQTGAFGTFLGTGGGQLIFNSFGETAWNNDGQWRMYLFQMDLSLAAPTLFGVAKSYSCTLNGGAKIDLSTNIAAAQSATVFAGGLAFGNTTIGGAANVVGDLYQVFLGTGVMTKDLMARIMSGGDFSTIVQAGGLPAPLISTKFTATSGAAPASVTDPNGYSTLNIQGTPTTVANPVFGGGSIGVHDPDRCMQRNIVGGLTAPTTITVGGVLTGTATGIDCQIEYRPQVFATSAAYTTGATVIALAAPPYGILPGFPVTGVNVSGTVVSKSISGSTVTLSAGSVTGAVASGAALTFGAGQVISARSSLSTVTINAAVNGVSSWTAQVPGLPEGSALLARFYITGGSTTCATVRYWGIGRRIGLGGQSVEGLFSGNPTSGATPQINSKFIMGTSYLCQQTNTTLADSGVFPGNGMTIMANNLAALLPDTMIELIYNALGGTTMLPIGTSPATTYWSNTAPGGLLDTATKGATMFGNGSMELYMWDQGQNDAESVQVVGAYLGGLNLVYNYILAASNVDYTRFKMMVAVIGPDFNGGQTDLSCQIIRNDITAFANQWSPPRFASYDTDIAVNNGGGHPLLIPGVVRLVIRQTQTILATWGLAPAPGIGPKPIKLTVKGTTAILTFTQQNGSALQFYDTTRIPDGIVFTDVTSPGGTPNVIPITGCSIVGNTLVFTLSRRRTSLVTCNIYQGFGILGLTTLTNAMTTTASSPTVTVAWPSHGLNVGSPFNIYTTATVGGLVSTNSSGQFLVVSTPDANTITYTALASATSGATGGGTIYAMQANYVTDNTTLQGDTVGVPILQAVVKQTVIPTAILARAA